MASDQSQGAGAAIPIAPKPAPPTPQEIKRKLGSPTEPVPLPGNNGAPTSLGSASGYLMEPKGTAGADSESGGVSRRGSNASNVSRRPSAASSSSVTSDEEPPSPSRPNQALHSISEASSGSDIDSDASSIRSHGNTHSLPSTSPSGAAKKSISKGLEKLKLSHTGASSGSNTRLRSEGEREMEIAKKSGYLMKKGERRKAWKKRWFVIRGGQLAMYKNDKEYQLLRLIPLSSIHSCSPIEMKRHSFTFGIVTPSRTYYVQADTNAEVDSWCKSIDRARTELNSAATVTSLETPTPAESSGQITPLATSTNMNARSPEISPTAAPAPQLLAPEGTKAIPMGPRAVATRDEGGQSYASTNLTASPSPPTPFSPANKSLLSSSYTSNSNSTSPQVQSTTRVPPNSLATGGLLAAAASTGTVSMGGLELEGVDDQLLRVQRGRDASLSSNQPLTSPMTTAGSSQQSQGSYFATGHSTGGSLFPPGSPGGGGVSSSEDDGELDDQPTGLGAGILRSPSMGQSPSGQTSTGAMDPNKVILSGYLMKQGKRKNWRKRWFVLMSGRLVYSRSHMDQKVHRQIPLTRILDALEMAPAESQPGQQGSPANHGGNPPPQFRHCFKIITPKRTYLVCAPSEEDEIKWLAALQYLVARKATNPQGPLPPIQTIPATPTRSESVKKQQQQGPQAPTLASHGRQRSVTDAARAAVKDVERRFHPTSPGLGGK